METSGDPESDPLDVLVRGAQAIAVVCCSSWIFYTFMNFCSAFADSVIGDNKVDSLMSNFTESVNITESCDRGKRTYRNYIFDSDVDRSFCCFM